MIHNLIAALVLVLVTAAVGYMTSPTRARSRAASAAYAAGVDLLARASMQPAQPATMPPWRTAPWVTGTGEQPQVGAQPACRCGGRRCRAHREGRDCAADGIAERTAFWAPPTAGRHQLTQAVARWLAGAWWDSPLPALERMRLARLAGAVRAPVQLATPGVGRLP